MTERNAETEEFGRFEFEDGSIYEGNFIEEDNIKVRHGKGTLTFSSNSALESRFEKYDGEWKNDVMKGFGVYEYINGAVYTGYWNENLHEGKGKYEFPDGSYYEGDWENHMMNGEGTFVSKEGQSWKGEFREGNFSSKMQNELKTQRRVETKKKNILDEVAQFLTDLNDLIEQDKKIIKDKLKKQFAVCFEEEVKIYLEVSSLDKFEANKIENWTTVIKKFGEGEKYFNVLGSPKEAIILNPNDIRYKQVLGHLLNGFPLYYTDQLFLVKD